MTAKAREVAIRSIGGETTPYLRLAADVLAFPVAPRIGSGALRASCPGCESVDQLKACSRVDPGERGDRHPERRLDRQQAIFDPIVPASVAV